MPLPSTSSSRKSRKSMKRSASTATSSKQTAEWMEMERILINYENRRPKVVEILDYELLWTKKLPIDSVSLIHGSSCSQEEFRSVEMPVMVKKGFEDFKSSKNFNKFQKGVFPINPAPILVNKASTRTAFNLNVLMPIESCLNLDFKILLEIELGAHGIPDFTMVRNEKGREDPFLIVQVTPCNAFCDQDDLQNLVKEGKLDKNALEKGVKFNKSVVNNPSFLENHRNQSFGGKAETQGHLNLRRALKQVKYYLWNMGTTRSFGILSSYLHTYLVILERNEQGAELLLSPVITFSDDNVLKKITEFIYMAFTSDSQKVTVKHSIERTRSGSARDNKKLKTDNGDGKEQLSDARYIMGNVIGYGRNGVMFKIFDTVKKETFAAKSPIDTSRKDIIGELENEYEIYSKMKSLQGKVVPHVHFFGFLDSWRPTIVMDFINAAPIDRLGKLFEDEKAAISNALEDIHGIGILHGDIRGGNILLERSKPVHAYFIDFGFSKTCNSKKAFKTEMKYLKCLLNTH